MSAMLQVLAPTDAQLAYIAGLCEERGLTPPEVVASKQEASDIIGLILRREYDPEDYLYPFRVGAGSAVLGDPDWKDSDSHAEDVWHARYDGVEDVQR